MNLAIRSITFYQQHISPHKGFCCAHRIATGGLSCSEFAKRSISAKGFFRALADIRRRFNECKQAAVQLQKSSKRKQAGKDTFIDRYCFCDPGCCAVIPDGASCSGAAATGGCDGCACTPF